MYFGILGPLVVRTADGEVALGASKPRTLLVRLLLDANRPVPADRLVDDLWSGQPPRSAAQTLQTYVSQLRKALGSDRVITEARGYRVVALDGELDSHRFESIVAEGRSELAAGDAAGALSKFRQAVSLWRGAALSDAASADWAAAESARLDELRLMATECLLEAQLALGDNRGVVASAEAAVTQDPLRERLWALLITALYRDGRQADALRAYQRVRSHLDEELGIEPGTELQDLERRVLRQEPDLAPKGEPRATPRSLPTGVVTFLLSDVVGSTRLWEKAPTAMSDAVSRHEELIRTAVERNHGVLLKSRGEGDSTFSVFQRATDAVAAAIDALNSLSDESWSTPSPLEVRIGVHTGEAVERDGDYYGRTVNRAARLRAASMPSQIAVSQATAELVVDDLPEGFRLHALGVQQLRDINRPETVFVITPVGEAAPIPVTQSEERVPLPPRLAVEPNMGFVGREREAEQLANAFKHATADSGRVVLVAGEPGIGKTGLAAQFARTRHNEGATVLFGRCDEDSGIPYRPWIEAIGHFIAHAGRSSIDRIGNRAAADLCRLVPALSDRRPGLAPSTPSDPDSDRWSLYGAVAELFAAAGADTPVVLVLDDLQWADKPSLLLLRHIVGAAQSSPLLVVGTYRDSELTAEHPLADVLAALRREPTAERLVLRGLADNEVVTLIRGASGQPLGDDAVGLIHAVCRETDGNPFFVEALLRHLAETGAVYLDDDGQWVPKADLGEAGLPESIREVVGHRVARLGEMCQRTLNVAAVIGQEFDLATIAVALDARENDVLDSLEAAEAAGLVSTFSPGSFTFSHALIATTLYTGLTPTRRAHLHRAVAEAIETVDPDGIRVAELARHWSAATAPTDRAKAIEYASQAGDRAMRSLAPDEALRWYKRALELLAERSENRRARADLLVRLGRAQRNAGDLAHRSTLLDAARLAQQIGDGKLLARAALANSQGFVGNVDRQIGDRLEMLEAALDAIDDADSVTRARLLATLAAELKVIAEFDRCRQLTDEAVSMARRLDNPPLLATVLNLAAFAIWHPKTLQERLAITAEAVAISERLGDRALLHWSANWRVHALVESGDVDEAVHWLDVMASIAAETQQPSLQWSNRAYRGALAMLHGDIDEAFRVSADAIRVAGPVSEIDTRIIDAGFVASAAWQRGTLSDHVGRMREEQAWYDKQAAALGMRSGVSNTMNKIQLVMAVSTRPLDIVGLLHQAAGSADAFAGRGSPSDSPRSMRTLVAQVLGDELDLEEDVLQLDYDKNIGWLGNQVLWTEVCDCFGNAADAADLLEALAPYHDQVASCGSLWPGAVAGALGILATKLDRIDEAEAYFAEAEAVNTRIRAPFFLARNRVNWARFLFRHGRSGDAEHAIELLESAIEVARQYDCAGVIRDAEALLATPPPMPPRLASAVRESFVGREAERQAIAVALGQGGGAVLVAGEPGIGKSALAATAADAVREKGSWIVHGRCDEDLRVPFLPFVDALTQLVAVLPDSVLDRISDRHLAELDRVAPNLRDRRPALGARQTTDPDTERYLLMNAVVATLVEASNVAPVIVVIDDLHWADKSTVMLLRHLMEGIALSKVSVLGTYRHTDLVADAPFAEELARLRSNPDVRHVVLAGLNSGEVAELTGAEPQLADALHRETDGNPFFAAELCRHLQETGDDLGATSLPHAVRSVVARRVARQGEEVRSTLVAASAIGQEFDLQLLAGVVKRNEDELLDQLERAERSALVETVAPGRFSFTHALIQHSLYDEIPPTRRIRLHRQIATAIEELDDSARRLTELARHWVEAAVSPDEVDRAVRYAADAADSALEALAPADAVRWYNQALELLSHQPTSDEGLRCRLLVGLTEAQVRAGDPNFRRTRVQAAELALRLDDTESLVAVVLKDYARAYTVSHDTTLTALLEEALRRVGPEASPQRARLLSRYCQNFLFSEPDKAIEIASEAVDMARQTGDRRTLAAVLAVRGWTRQGFDERWARSMESIEIAEETGDPGIIFDAVYYHGWVSNEAQDPGHTEELLAKLRQIVGLVGRPDFKWTLMVNEASNCLLRGDVAEAERLTLECYELGRELQQEGLDVIHGALLQSVRWHQGRQAEGHELMAAAAREEPDLALLRLPVTLVGSSSDDNLVQAVHDLPHDSAWILGATILADIIASRDDSAAAALLYDEMLPHRLEWVWIGPMCRGSVSHSLAVLARTKGDRALAEEHFTTADDVNTRMKAPFFQARTWLEWAKLLFARDGADDRSRAEDMLCRALEEAKQRGYAQLERRAERALASLH